MAASKALIHVLCLWGSSCSAVGANDLGEQPCISGRCQNGWHDLDQSTWDCVNNNITTDVKFQSALSHVCAGTDLDVKYQTCTEPCCACWSAYWPALLDLWGRCGAPASYVEGNGVTGLKAKEDWLCGTGVWGTSVRPKWDALRESAFTQCTSAADEAKLAEVFGLYRDRRSAEETCACMQQAVPALTELLKQCDVSNWQWFKDYGQRRLRDNRCAPVELGEIAVPTAVDATALVSLAGVVGGSVVVGFLAVARRRRADAELAGAFVPLLGEISSP